MSCHHTLSTGQANERVFSFHALFVHVYLLQTVPWTIWFVTTYEATFWDVFWACNPSHQGFQIFPILPLKNSDIPGWYLTYQVGILDEKKLTGKDKCSFPEWVCTEMSRIFNQNLRKSREPGIQTGVTARSNLLILRRLTD